MNIKKIRKERLKSLENAYEQLMKVLNKELDMEEIDPEKMKISAAVYKQAAEDSEIIYNQILSIMEDEGKIIISKENKDTSGLSPESRIKR